MSKLREGDIYLFDTLDGGEILIKNGEPEMDGGFESAVYLSYFGQSKTPWWANEHLNESEKITSQFYPFILGTPKTTQSINKAEELASQDVQWFVDEGICDNISVEIKSLSANSVSLETTLLANKNILFKNEYQVNWGFQQNDPASGRI